VAAQYPEKNGVGLQYCRTPALGVGDLGRGLRFAQEQPLSKTESPKVPVQSCTSIAGFRNEDKEFLCANGYWPIEGGERRQSAEAAAGDQRINAGQPLFALRLATAKPRKPSGMSSAPLRELRQDPAFPDKRYLLDQNTYLFRESLVFVLASTKTDDSIFSFHQLSLRTSPGTRLL
jgi:hypothetical protein